MGLDVAPVQGDERPQEGHLYIVQLDETSVHGRMILEIGLLFEKPGKSEGQIGAVKRLVDLLFVDVAQ